MNKKNSLIVLLIAFYIVIQFKWPNPYLKLSNENNQHKNNILINSVIPNTVISNVYIFLVDGLRYDSVMSDMKYLSRLINDKKASLIKAKFTGTSDSRPGYARIFTGCPTNINGVWKNEQEEPCKIINLFELAKHHGLSTGAVSFYWMSQLFSRNVILDKLYINNDENLQYSYFYSNENEKDSFIFKTGLSMIKKFNPNLFIIHPMEVDIAGHKYGAISHNYKRCVSNTDKLIENALNEFDFQNTIVIVLSDHGHRNNGGHGGNSPSENEVPVIFIGNSIKGGIYNKITSQEDIAPTICKLLGIPLSPYMKGKVIEFTF